MKRSCFIAFFLLAGILNAQNRSFSGKLTVKAVTLQSSLSDEGSITGKTETEQQYSCDLALTYDPGINNPTKARLEYCKDNNATCQFLYGNNEFLPAPREVVPSGFTKSPVVYSTHSTSWEVCDGKMREVHKSEGGGNLTDYLVRVSIGFLSYAAPVSVPTPVRKVATDADDFLSIPLVKGDFGYRLYINIGGITPNINQLAPKSREQSRDCTIDQWTTGETPKFGLSIPGFTELESHKNSSSTPENYYFSRYTPVTEAQVKELLATGKLNLEHKYYSFSRDLDGNGKAVSESERRVWLTLRIF